ncbi:PHD-finger [Ostertagia ostertagi]
MSRSSTLALNRSSFRDVCPSYTGGLTAVTTRFSYSFTFTITCSSMIRFQYVVLLLLMDGIHVITNLDLIQQMKEERRAAALKYGLRPEDYKPMDQDDVVRYAGDYPDFGIITYDHKDPYEAWTDRHYRRNWGEMVPIDMMRYRPDRLTFTGLEAEDFTTWGSIIMCLRVLVPMALLSWLFCNEDPNALRWKNPAPRADTSEMLFLDDFLEMLDELPAELRERCTEMRQIDMQVEAGLAQNRQALIEFFDCGGQLTEEQKQHRYQELQKEYNRLRLLGEMKVSLAERMQEVLETYMQYLDKEKTHFKYELEADNPGITEVIETRFANYCESLIALRKERKRKLTNGSVDNGSEPQAKISRFPMQFVLHLTSLFRVATDGNALSSYIRTEFTLGDEEIESPMVSGAGPIRSRKAPIDDYNIIRRRSTSVGLKTSQSAPSTVITNSVSPAVSEKSWTPLSSLPILEELPPSSALTPTSLCPTAQVTPSTTPTTMPTFVGPESRHGRPRKLTSRVQEMFKEAVQRQRHHYHRSIDTVHTADVSTEDDDEISEEDDDDGDDSKRKWCFCNEKSYGDMVACDNKACPYQWFHYPCVNISATPKGRWYCPHCVDERARRSESGDFNAVSAATVL